MDQSFLSNQSLITKTQPKPKREEAVKTVSHPPHKPTQRPKLPKIKSPTIPKIKTNPAKLTKMATGGLMAIVSVFVIAVVYWFNTQVASQRQMALSSNATGIPKALPEKDFTSYVDGNYQFVLDYPKDKTPAILDQISSVKSYNSYQECSNYCPEITSEKPTTINNYPAVRFEGQFSASSSASPSQFVAYEVANPETNSYFRLFLRPKLDSFSNEQGVRELTAREVGQFDQLANTLSIVSFLIQPNSEVFLDLNHQIQSQGNQPLFTITNRSSNSIVIQGGKTDCTSLLLENQSGPDWQKLENCQVQNTPQSQLLRPGQQLNLTLKSQLPDGSYRATINYSPGNNFDPNLAQTVNSPNFVVKN